MSSKTKNNLLVLWEKLYPIFGGLIVGYATWWHFHEKPMPEKIYDMMANGINLGGIAIGFLGTTIALIYSLQNNYIVEQLKKLGHFKTFLSQFKATVRWCMILAVMGAIGFFLDFKSSDHTKFYHIFFSIWICTLVTAGLSAYRFIRVLCTILHDT